MVNDVAFTAAARTPDPERLLAAYHQSSSTLNLLRAFTKGGFADLSRVHQWNQDFVAGSRQGRRYEQLAAEIDRAMRFMKACGFATESEPKLHEVDFYTSHEALILGYEEATDPAGLAHRRLVRLLGPPAVDRRPHASARRGAHRLRARHRQPGRREDRADVVHRQDVVELCEALNPHRRPGRLTLVTQARRRSDPRAVAGDAAGRRPRRDIRSCGAATRCTATRSRPTPAARPAIST